MAAFTAKRDAVKVCPETLGDARTRGDLEALLALAHKDGGQRDKPAGSFPLQPLPLAINARADVDRDRHLLAAAI